MTTPPTVAISPLANILASINQHRRKVSALAHEGVLLTDPLSEPHYFRK